MTNQERKLQLQFQLLLVGKLAAIFRFELRIQVSFKHSRMKNFRELFNSQKKTDSDTRSTLKLRYLSFRKISSLIAKSGYWTSPGSVKMTQSKT